MWEQNCGVVPVVDQGRVLGLLTDRDICMATYTQGKPPGAIPVAQAMSHQVYGCSADDSIGAALSLMAEQRLHRLPVLSPDGHLTGMLALADIARFAASAGSAHLDAALAETLGAISKPQVSVAQAAE
jgi:CBS domain-containing protein